MLSLAGGLDVTASSIVKITPARAGARFRCRAPPRTRANSSRWPKSGSIRFSKAEKPENNIPVQPYGIITVPRAELVYVIGEVEKAGGFALAEHERMTVLKGVRSRAGWIRPPRRIHRAAAQFSAKTEIGVDLKSIVAGRSPDLAMQLEDANRPKLRFDFETGHFSAAA